MPVRSTKALMSAVDLMADRFQPHFHLLVQRLGQDLGERIRDEQDSERLVDWMDSRQALARHGDRFFTAFIERLRQGCLDAYDHTPPAPPESPFRERSQPLSLLDAEIVDEDGTLAGIAARHESRASHSLMLLGQRFAVLLERPPLSASELPIGPHAFGRALQHAARQTGLQLHSRMALYKLHDEENASRYAAAMEAVDAVLDAAGVLPGLSFVPLRPRVVPHHPERGQGHAPAPGLVAEIVAMRVVNEAVDKLVPQGTLPEQRFAERREAVAAMVRLVSRYGPDSKEWQRCQGVMAEVAASAAERRPARPGTAEWIRAALVDLGYSEVECRRLSEALVHFGQDIAQSRAAAAGAADEGRSPQRARPSLPATTGGPVTTGRRGGNVQ